MPTVLRQRGFEVKIRTDDHDPPHVHIGHGGEEIVINLGIGTNAPEIREIRGMSRPKIARAMKIVIANNDTLLREWQRIHQ